MVFEKVREVIANELGIEKEKITLESRLIEDLAADSLDAVEVIMQLEDEYNISIDDEAAQNIKTVGDLVDFVNKAI